MRAPPPHAARLWPLWLLGLPVALATTRGLQACPAPATLVVGLAAAAAACLGASRLLEGRRWAIPLLVAGLLAGSLLPVALTITTPAIANGHDLALHLWGLWGTAREMADGSPWPRWHPELGLGQPLLGFYPPATHWLGGPLLLTGLAPTQAAKVLGWLSGALAAGGGWVVLRDRGAGRTAAGITALALIVAPYRLLDLNYRYALGELFGLALVLPMVHLTWRVVGGHPGRLIRRPKAALWLVLSAMALTHPISGLMAAWATLPALALDAWRPRDRTRRLPGLTAALLVGGLAFATAGAFLVPGAADSGATRVGGQVPDTMVSYRSKALHPVQTLVRERWNGRRLSFTLEQERRRKAEGKPIDEVPFYLGWGLALAILLALVPGRRGPEGRAPPAAPGLALGALLAWASTFPIAATVMGHVDIFLPLQFPWRFLGPASVLGAGCLGLVFDRWLRAEGRRAGAALTVAAVVLLAWDGVPGYGAGDLLGVRLDTPMYHLVRRSEPHPACRSEAAGWRRMAVPAEPPSLPPPPPPGDWRAPPGGDLPERVWGLFLPPNELDVEVALAWRAFPEGWSRPLHRSLVKPARQRDRQALRGLGVARRYQAVSEEPGRVTPAPRVRLDTGGEEHALAARVKRLRPAHVVLHLPEGHPGGRLTFVEQRMPGWQTRIDGGPWTPAAGHRGLLVADLDPGARRLEFRRDPLRADRVAGTLLSLLGLLAGLVLLRREGRPR